MLANIPYAEAKQQLFPGRQQCRLGTHHELMLQALDQLGIPHGPVFTNVKRWADIKTNALVHIRWRSMPDGDHWVVAQRLPDGRLRTLDPASFADVPVHHPCLAEEIS
jgi:hypothetical protein